MQAMNAKHVGKLERELTVTSQAYRLLESDRANAVPSILITVMYTHIIGFLGICSCTCAKARDAALG